MAAIHPLILVLAAATSACVARAAPPVAPKATMSEAECEVWARELSFAAAVVRHDAVSFAEHLHPQAVFGSGQPVPTRGRAAIAEEWAGLVAGTPVALSWYPTRTTIAGVDGIATSSGPALFEDARPDAPQRYRMSSFHSVWHRDADGTWRILFDDGTAPRPVDADEAAAFRAGRQERCPQPHSAAPAGG